MISTGKIDGIFYNANDRKIYIIGIHSVGYVLVNMFN